ncbi:HNH endonuclease [Falsihalocynthiibacter sp. S25ZX9]|uniref:HNH endonuclease n=1 Tax=Falsihalocynthiibacter sp. S25ZX9 TaxID=3240870 RepID=UPI00350FD034
MKQLLPVQTPPNHIDVFESIRNNKKRGLAKTALLLAESDIRDRFTEYETRLSADTLAAMPASTLGGIRDELRSCYAPTKRMNELKQAIRDAQPKGRLLWCPYCGATTPGSYDHYLPAGRFPEFAAHALNLVPACGRCNSTKGEEWLNAGARQYLHFYQDAIPVVPFLSVTITSDHAACAVGATFSVQRAGMQAEEWALVEAHFQNLRLIEYYDGYSNDFINTILRSARSYISNGGASAADFLASEAAENASLYGEYGWRAVLLNAMSTHPDLSLWIAWL